MKKLLFGSVLFVIVFFQSCKKEELYESSAINTSAGNFFTSEMPLENWQDSLLHRLKKDDEQSHFVNKLPLHSGHPIWNKMVRLPNQNHSSSSFSGLTSGDSTIVIPFTEDNSILSSVLSVELANDHISYADYTQSYLYHKTHSADSAYAENLLRLFMLLENKAFGRTLFYHIPANLFPNAAPLDLSNGFKTVRIKGATDSTAGSNLQAVGETCTFEGWEDACGHPWNGTDDIPLYPNWECYTIWGGGIGYGDDGSPGDAGDGGDGSTGVEVEQSRGILAEREDGMHNLLVRVILHISHKM